MAHKLDRKKLENLLMQMTGLEQGNHTISAISGTFEALKGLAKFEQMPAVEPQNGQLAKIPLLEKEPANKNVGINLSYTINLVLPKTNDIAVFNAIFKSIRDNLLNQ